MTDTSNQSGGGQGQGYFGQMGISDTASRFHWVYFMIKQAVAELRTNVPVQIMKVKGGGVGPPPTVDVQPVVKQMDGVGNTSSHTTVYGRPVMRIQGGTNAIICDPVKGDCYHMAVHDRDITSVVNNSGANSTPGSRRRHSMSDGVAMGAMVNKATPTNYVDINGHIHILSASDVTITDKTGNKIIMNPSGIFVAPGGGGSVYLGAATSGSCYPVVTTGGNSPNVYAFV